MTARDASILSEKVADFAPTDADVTCRNVDILADMALELQHERLAEPHHFVFGLTFRIKVRTTFTATDRKAGQGIFEDLFKTKELDDAQVHRRVEAETALIWPEDGIKLNTETTVDLDIPLVINPRNTEDNLTFRLGETLDEPFICIVIVFTEDVLQTAEDLLSGLMKFRLARVPLENLLVILINCFVDVHDLPSGVDFKHASISVVHEIPATIEL